MRTISRHGLLFFVLLSWAGCGSSGGADSSPDAAAPADANIPADAGWDAKVTVLETLDVSGFNTDLVDGMPTMDVAFYVTDGGPIEWAHLEKSIVRAKKIFGVPGVQVRVSAALRISIPEEWQTLDADDMDVPTTPSYLDTDLYAHLDELKTRPTARNKAIIEAIIAHFPEQASGVPAANTIHVLTINEAPIGFYEWSGTEWTLSESATGGLSFPPYAYADRIPIGMRGIITLSLTLTGVFADSKALSHEIGHKTINVSHEGIGVCPTFEANGADLMLYGNGERIPAGAEGRWQVERLLLSPFIYKLESGVARFATTYQDGGVYRDRIYGDYMVDPPCIPSQN